ncbi:hypothetical protein ABPG75_011290 [Micractinium tetrahymenae]
MSAAVQCTPGAFRRLGKPKGAAYWFLRHALSYCISDIDNCHPFVLDSPHCPLFSRLSLSHRLALLADLAQGLLCPETPLPPDTLEHHATFLYLFSFALQQVHQELDMEADGCSDEQVEEAEGQPDAASQNVEDLGELSEDDSAEVAQQLRSAVQAAAPAMAAAEAASVQGGPAAGHLRERQAHSRDEAYRGMHRSVSLMRREDREEKKQAARAAGELRGRSDEELVSIMMSGRRCERDSAAAMAARIFMQLAPDAAAATAAMRDWYQQHLLRDRLRKAEDTPLPAGCTSFRSLLAAHVRQRFPQLSHLDKTCGGDPGLWDPLCSLRHGVGVCLELSDIEMELQHGAYNDAYSARSADVAHRLLVDRYIQHATVAFEQRWEPEMDNLHWRLLEASSPHVGGYELPFLKPYRSAQLVEHLEHARRWRSRYIRLLHSAAENPAALQAAEQLKSASSIEDFAWVPDWHKAVRRLGGYGDLSARLQAVRLVHPRHPAAATVGGRPRWLGGTPQEQVAALRKEEWNVQCDLCRKQAEVGEKFPICSRCHVCVYCSKDCQAADWPYHKADCGKLAAAWEARQAALH